MEEWFTAFSNVSTISLIPNEVSHPFPNYWWAQALESGSIFHGFALQTNGFSYYGLFPEIKQNNVRINYWAAGISPTFCR